MTPQPEWTASEPIAPDPIAPDPIAADPIAPDTKDWTWTLQRTCPDCGFAAAQVTAAELGSRTRELTRPWPQVLGAAGATVRPTTQTWSALEYGCHVRDVCRLFRVRVLAMLAQDGTRFDNWDQDRTALEQRYSEQDPAVVGREVTEAGAAMAELFERVEPSEWGRVGVRSDGSPFTVLTLGQYFLHDLAHHLVDVGA